MATSLSTLNSSAAHGPLPHTVSNLLDIMKNSIEAPDIEPHPTDGTTEDENEDASYGLQGMGRAIGLLFSSYLSFSHLT